ncbi:calcium-binding protein [Archangium violaceum]|uniref:Calcium-binding protein n=1 Tax=Archangium violaceum Cb vi76 TaxID=1406225 RepID=A0A084SZI4_9BACT|nr:calcium-binding protein [Archangium violaceum]KFA93869.1 calcium-binding protein [Archangium violaceum Cb vi76]
MGIDSVGGSSSRSSSNSVSSTSTSSKAAADAVTANAVTAKAVSTQPSVNFDRSTFEPARNLAGMPNLMSPTSINNAGLTTAPFDAAKAFTEMPELLQATPLSPTPQTFVDDFTVPEGQLTFDAEGLETRGAYFSREAHWPGGASGATIGRGYDMKHRSAETVISDLTAAGVPQADAELLAQGAGLSGQEAADFVAREDVKAIEITPLAQKNLFSTVYDHYESEVQRISNKPDTVAKYGSVDWDNLDPAIKDVAVDLIYRGDYTPATRKEIQPLMVANDLQGLRDLLADETRMTGDWGVPQDRFERRRDYLDAALNAQ